MAAGPPTHPAPAAPPAGGPAGPVGWVDIGGVANGTWIGAGGIGEGEDEVLAFDTGPGNALINDWVEQHGGEPLDRDGALAAAGRVDATILAGLLDNRYFDRRPPKSLDRDDFSAAPVAGLSLEDGDRKSTRLNSSH